MLRLSVYLMLYLCLCICATCKSEKEDFRDPGTDVMDGSPPCESLEPGSSEKVTSSLNCWAISLAPKDDIFRRNIYQEYFLIYVRVSVCFLKPTYRLPWISGSAVTMACVLRKINSFQVMFCEIAWWLYCQEQGIARNSLEPLSRLSVFTGLEHWSLTSCLFYRQDF